MQWYERVLPCAESMSSSRAQGRIFKILEARVSLMSLSDGTTRLNVLMSLRDGLARLNVPDRALVARPYVATESPQQRETETHRNT